MFRGENCLSISFITKKTDLENSILTLNFITKRSLFSLFLIVNISLTPIKLTLNIKDTVQTKLSSHECEKKWI